MNLDEMKLAVCEKLPKLIAVEEYDQEDYCSHLDNPTRATIQRIDIWWKTTNKEVNWPTEGLQVCHEAEKLLTSIEYLKWWPALCRAVWGSPITMESSTRLVHEATYEQRLEALCRVWWPERFTT